MFTISISGKRFNATYKTAVDAFVEKRVAGRDFVKVMDEMISRAISPEWVDAVIRINSVA